MIDEVRIAFLSFIAAFLAAASLAAAQDARATVLIPSDVSEYPRQSLVFMPPAGAEPKAADFQVSADNRRVKGLAVTPAADVPGSFGVVFVLNASKSVPEAAIAKQMAAVRDFAAKRPARLPMGVVTYNGVSTVLVPPTTDSRTLTNALRNAPPRFPGSRLRDATSVALNLIKTAKLGSGVVVAMAGAADRGSRETAASLGRTARANHARVFAVGLGQTAGVRAALRELESSGVARSLGAQQPTALLNLHRSMASQFSQAAVLSFETTARPGSEAAVSVRAGDVAAKASAVVPPRPPLPPAPAVASDGALRDFVTSSQGQLLITMIVMALIFGGFTPLLLMAQRNSVQRRVAEYAGPAPEKPSSGLPELADPDARKSVFADRISQIAYTIELAGFTMEAEKFIAFTIAGTVMATIMVVAVSKFVLLGLLVAVGVPLAVRKFVNMRVAKQRLLFADQLADSLQTTAAAMRAGHSFAAALATLVDDAPQPASREFARVTNDERLGIPLEDALRTMINRMDNTDLEQVAMVAILQRETGGNGAEALDRVVENIRGRDDVRRLVNTLTAQGRMSRWVLTAIPVGLGLVLSMLSAEYMRPMFHELIGILLLCVAVVMVATGSWIIGKIVDIKV